MRLLVTGREGQVAQALLALASDELDVVALGRPELDLTDRATIERAIAAHRPDVVVNAAAYTAVDKAESDEAAAFAVNRDGAGHAAAAAAAAGLPIVHLSTDYVFPGDKDGRYREDDATGPQGVYGRSKLAGEAAVASANPRHAILRTAWVYGAYGNNFLKTMLRLAETRDVLRVVADQLGTPTYAPDIAEGVVRVARRLREPGASDATGVFHMVCEGETNWAGFAGEIFAVSALDGGPSALVEPITTAEYPTPAKRPANSRLDTTLFGDRFGALPDWRSGVVRCLAALKANAPA
ncbi:dTDP-4-dehydrorhamnose reductase [Aureimonas pseudogalii]|uniref:dTDP-4-dehydrorhamnose reductase n=1 Tax=Aureimonas pseudogalii TaxID=1744844 RepID=A0A7W6ECB4_9HYPH|nr:dTDP-4-dehydrorhamnose reductase [Aureimonas pseudogalii]MBB3998229.1 dTDP-4-dehydrorhamnose reductase [Aureimonas pseudogalii]